jgi:hypothetical protein
MQIILQGGHYDGDRTEIDKHVWQLAPYGNIYKIAAGEFMDGRQVFRFDEKATLEGKHRKPDGPDEMPTGSAARRQPAASESQL